MTQVDYQLLVSVTTAVTALVVAIVSLVKAIRGDSRTDPPKEDEKPPLTG